MKERRPERRARGTDVLILTSSTGGGHDSVAVALQQAMHELAPEAVVQVLDPLSGRTSTSVLSPAWWYDATVIHAPWIWGLFYHATNNAAGVRLGMAAGALLWARRLRSVIEDEQPRLVVSVHPLCTRLAAAVLRTLPDAPALHCVVTDLVTTHRCWACEDVDAFYVATPDARDALVDMAIPDNRILVTGLPLRASFAQAPRALEADASANVLVLGGGCTSRRVERIVRALVESCPPLRIAVVCGHNTRLRRRLTRSIGAHAIVLGWREDVAALMRWSSIVIAKAGPTTLAEALSQARPVVVHRVLPGQEGGNVELFERLGCGRYIPEVDVLVRAVVARLEMQPPCDEARQRLRPKNEMAQAAWWVGAAHRVATRLLADCDVDDARDGTCVATQHASSRAGAW